MQLAPGTWINPHKSLLGLGNYDVNVLMSALQSRGYEAKWFDKRKPLSILVVENIFGFVLNVPSNFRVVGIVPLPFLKQKHWIALRSVGSSFYNLDSNLKKPEELGKVCCIVTVPTKEGHKFVFLLKPCIVICKSTESMKVCPKRFWDAFFPIRRNWRCGNLKNHEC